ncbi:hypothetical protein [Rhizobium sp.]|uniref:hypothetical protein n=1 Tax=Rhizobium sp. TaxID=391 RepID=UPI003982660D
MKTDNDGLAEDSAPTELDMLCGVIEHLFPERSRTRPERRIDISEIRPPDADELEAATSALADKRADAHVNAAVALKLLDAIEALGRNRCSAPTLSFLP